MCVMGACLRLAGLREDRFKEHGGSAPMLGCGLHGKKNFLLCQMHQVEDGKWRGWMGPPFGFRED